MLKATLMSSVFIVFAGNLSADPPEIIHNRETGKWDSNRFDLITDLIIGKGEGNDEEMFGRIVDISVDTRGSIYVLDAGYSRVQRYDSSGLFVQTLGREGEGPGEFFGPTSIAVDKSNNLYVADRSYINIFDANGNYVSKFGHGLTDGMVRSVRIDENTGIYLSCFTVFEQQIVHKYSFEHERLFSFCDSYAIGQDIDVRVERVCAGGDIDIDDEGRIYYTQITPYEIRLYSPEGELIATVYRDNNFMFPASVELRPDGGMRLGPFAGSYSIVVLKDKQFLNVVKVPPDPGAAEVTKNTIIDLFDRNGRLLVSKHLDRNITVMCRDNAGRLYAAGTEDYPIVIRYRAQFN